jgi:transcription elongation factor GreB
MSKAFTKEEDGEGDDDDATAPDATAPADVKNYMTPTGFAALQGELRHLLYGERPTVVEVVSWAAGNGDRSENGDYIYGKRRLREIDRRVRYLSKRLESAEVVDPAAQQALKQVFFGATVTYVSDDDRERIVMLVGTDEAHAETGKISWLSPVAKVLMKAKVGDVVPLALPTGRVMIEVVKIRYVMDIQ